MTILDFFHSKIVLNRKNALLEFFWSKADSKYNCVTYDTFCKITFWRDYAFANWHSYYSNERVRSIGMWKCFWNLLVSWLNRKPTHYSTCHIRWSSFCFPPKLTSKKVKHKWLSDWHHDMHHKREKLHLCRVTYVSLVISHHFYTFPLSFIHHFPFSSLTPSLLWLACSPSFIYSYIFLSAYPVCPRLSISLFPPSPPFSSNRISAASFVQPVCQKNFSMTRCSCITATIMQI